MGKKRVYEIAKEQGVTSAELLEALKKAGIEVKAAASSVEEKDALSALNGSASNKEPKSLKSEGSKSKSTEKPKQSIQKKQVRQAASQNSDKEDEATTASTKKRRVVIDAQASRKPQDLSPPQTGKSKRGKKRKQEEPEKNQADIELSEQEDRKQLVKVNSGANVGEVAYALDVPVPDLIKELMKLGEMASITQTLSDEAIQLLAGELGYEVELVHVADEQEATESFDDSEEDLQLRPPVVVVMGHVDHGKTSLLDAIRQTDVVAQEAGGITQHIGAYQVHHGDKVIAFLDTPGHEAFTAMRARGAKVTDVAVIVVAADDGVKPQTVEAIDHAKAAGVPMVIAINKVDKEGANPEKVRSELATQDLTPEEWGGDTVFCDVSAKTKQGLEDLLDMIVLVTEVEELKANPDTEASGAVIESKLDPGRGPVVTVLIQRGTLKVGDAMVAGSHWGRVKAMHDYLGKDVDQALPGDPIEILGLNGVPDAGEFAKVIDNERHARQLAEERETRIRTEQLGRSRAGVSLEDLFNRIKEGRTQQLNLLIKADVAGSLEAIEDELAKLPQDEIELNIVHKAVGGVNESDVMLATASEGVVIAFNVRPLPEAKATAAREGIEIRTYSVIYKLVDELRAAMEGMLEPEEIEQDVGTVEVREVFKASKVGSIAGCYVTDGKVSRGSRVRIVRDGTVIFESQIESLKRFKDDVKEVDSGYECGVIVKDYADVKAGDLIEVFEIKKVERHLT